MLGRCFDAEDDVASEHGQPFLFRPRPARPPILVGGSGSHALERAARYGDGWLPMLADPARLAGPIAELKERFEQAAKPPPQVVCFAAFPPGDQEAGLAQVAALREIGVTGIIAGLRYSSVDEFAAGLEPVAQVRAALADE